MNPIDVIGLTGWVILAAFCVACGLIMLALGRSAAVGDNIAARAAEDREIETAAQARIFSDPHRFDQDHEVGR